MYPDQAVDLVRQVLIEAFIVSAPLLFVTCVVSMTVSVLQTLTGIQDQTLTVVPRLVVLFGIILITLPWIVHRIANYTLHLFTNLHVYVGQM
jgi:flagellar biosynthesis protein FliQ